MIRAGAVRGVRIEQFIAIDGPVSEVYAQWTRFDWSHAIAGRDFHWSAAIVESLANRRIAWRGRGDCVFGVAAFEPLGDERTGVAVQIDREPVSLLARIGCSCGLAAAAVAHELQRFKLAIEAMRFRHAHIDAQRRELERFRSLIGEVRVEVRSEVPAELVHASVGASAGVT